MFTLQHTLVSYCFHAITLESMTDCYVDPLQRISHDAVGGFAMLAFRSEQNSSMEPLHTCEEFHGKPKHPFTRAFHKPQRPFLDKPEDRLSEQSRDSVIHS
jgi:hypothetical protein